MPRSRRLTLAAVAGTALVGTAGAVVGVAAADVIGTPGTRSHAPGSHPPGSHPPGSQAAWPGTDRPIPTSRPSSPTAGSHASPTAGTHAGPTAGSHASPTAGPTASRAAAYPKRHVARHEPETECRSVAHVGDSTSVDLMSPLLLPERADRLPARYAAVGVKHITIKASGGRSVIEALPGQVNGYDTAKAIAGSGFKGCWVFALGTNDAANIAAGSPISAAARIAKMMSVAHGQPVLWVNTVTRTPTGPWASAHERVWDAALASAVHKYPNMRIFNWAARARPGWFLSDGIHYNSLGCLMRAKAIAGALAAAFPGTS
ncbi:MAG TPA: hypothetical protein VFQ44_24615 [Streptosporangiaceae bacterium]|nr:hypothetical protein [Streptosporangiaceae bacterium]